MLRVSVLIPCYNAAPYIEETLESVFSQGVDLHEVVVVDDGSTDGSGDLVLDFGDRVRYHRQANAGISSARNTALALATGYAIAFLDADDVWPERSLSSRMRALGADATIGYVYGRVEQFVSPDITDAAAARHGAAHSAPTAGRLAGAMLVRRSVFDSVGGFNPALRVGETLDWIARADHLEVRNRSIPDLVLRRRLHATNTGLMQQASRTDYLAVARAALGRRRQAIPDGLLAPTSPRHRV